MKRWIGVYMEEYTMMSKLLRWRDLFYSKRHKGCMQAMVLQHMYLIAGSVQHNPAGIISFNFFPESLDFFLFLHLFIFL